MSPLNQAWEYGGIVYDTFTNPVMSNSVNTSKQRKHRNVLNYVTHSAPDLKYVSMPRWGGAAPPHWPNQLEAWLEDAFPVDVNIVKTHGLNRSHTVHDASKSATNSCFLARAMRGLIASFGLLPDAKPDLVLLEYGALPVRTEGQPLSRSTWEPGDHDVMLKQPSLARRGTPPPLCSSITYTTFPRAPLCSSAPRAPHAHAPHAHARAHYS